MEDFIQIYKDNEEKFQKYVQKDYIKALKEDYKKRYIKEEIEHYFHKLFDSIDWELKCNQELNTAINELAKIEDDLSFDSKKFFYSYETNDDSYVSLPYFNEQKYNNAKNHYLNWENDKKTLLEEVEKWKSSNHLKFVINAKINKIDKKIAEGDYFYKRYSEIFKKEEEINKLNRNELTQEYETKKAAIDKVINSSIQNHLAQSLKKNPELVIFGQITKNDYTLSSSAFLSNKLNKNLPRYFNSKTIFSELNKVFKEYQDLNKQNETENQQKSQEQ